MEMSNLYKDIMVILAELSFFILLFFIINFSTGALFAYLSRVRFLSHFQHRIEIIRHNIKGILIVFVVGLCTAVAGWDGYIIFREGDLTSYTLDKIRQVEPDFWIEAGLGLAKIIILVIVATLLIRLAHRFLFYLQEKAKAFEQIKANDESIEIFFTSFTRMADITIWLGVFALSAALMPFSRVVATYVLIAFKIYLIVSLGFLTVKGIQALVDSLDALSKKYSSPDNLLRFYDQLRVLIPLFRRCLEFGIYVSVASLVAYQIDFIAPFAEYGARIIKVIGVFFLSRVVVEIGYLLVDESMLKKVDIQAGEYQSRLTLVPIVKSSLKYLIYSGALIIMLKVMSINPTPILAGAGIVGLVVGLGAQPLINDIVSGLFILFEDLYRVGDFVEMEKAYGTVEAIDIRTTRVRGSNGEQHILRNGKIEKIINYSKGYAYAVVDVGVAYDSDLNHVYEVLYRTGRDLQRKNGDVLDPPEIQGLEKFGDSALLIRCATRVKPGRHLHVARDFRKLIKEAFDREEIEIPCTPRVVLFKKDAPA